MAKVAGIWGKKSKQNSNPEILKTIIAVSKIFQKFKISCRKHILRSKWKSSETDGCMRYLINSVGENLESNAHKISFMYHTRKAKCFPFCFNSHSFKILKTACSCLQKCNTYVWVGSVIANFHFQVVAMWLVCEKNSFHGIKRSLRMRAIFRSRYLTLVFFYNFLPILRCQDKSR